MDSWLLLDHLVSGGEQRRWNFTSRPRVCAVFMLMTSLKCVDRSNGKSAAGAPLSFLMYPQAETGNGRKDCLDPETFRYKITSRALD